MASLDSRLSKLEAGAGVDECRCSPPRVVYADDWREPGERPVESEVCGKCGKRRVTLTVKYTDDWRQDDAK